MPPSSAQDSWYLQPHPLHHVQSSAIFWSSGPYIWAIQRHTVLAEACPALVFPWSDLLLDFCFCVWAPELDNCVSCCLSFCRICSRPIISFCRNRNVSRNMLNHCNLKWLRFGNYRMFSTLLQAPLTLPQGAHSQSPVWISNRFLMKLKRQLLLSQRRPLTAHG